jgi:predicted O-methyltransferase YrrM
MSVIHDKFIQLCNTPSDIYQHLPTLHEYAKKCNTIAEFGVRFVVSSYAFAAAKPKKLTCVDIITFPEVLDFVSVCKKENVNMEFIEADTLKLTLKEPVDLLFIDTKHDYAQLSKELHLHHSNVNKYIILHDTINFGFIDEDRTWEGKKGLMPAIIEFLQWHPYWKHVQTYPYNNGLTVLRKTLNQFGQVYE